MSRHTIGVVGVALLAAGIVGLIAGFGAVVWWGGQTARAPSTSLSIPVPPNVAPVPPTSPTKPDAGTGGYSSNGQRIYETGVGHNGTIPAVGGLMGKMSGALGCAICHGADGRGGKVGMMRGTLGIETPDIRYSALSSPTVVNGKTVPGWTAAGIAAAIRTGVEPDGTHMNPVMPRYDMDTTDMVDLIAYLKELS